MVSRTASSPGLRQWASDILLATVMNSANLKRRSPRILCIKRMKSSLSCWAVWYMGGKAWTWCNHFVFKRESNLSRMLTQREEKNWKKCRTKKLIQGFDQAILEAWATSGCFKEVHTFPVRLKPFGLTFLLLGTQSVMTPNDLLESSCPFLE